MVCATLSSGVSAASTLLLLYAHIPMPNPKDGNWGGDKHKRQGFHGRHPLPEYGDVNQRKANQ